MSSWLYRRGRRVVRRHAKRHVRRAFISYAVMTLGVGAIGAQCTGAPVFAPREPLHWPWGEVSPSTSAGPPAPASALAALVVDDAPFAGPKYDREQWPHWLDLDENGCDAREDALIAAAPGTSCVAGRLSGQGRWPLVYVDGETTDPKALDIDHVVALGLAHRSGGWAWTTERRAQFANDPANLWAVQAAANRAKSDKSADEWRPDVQNVWCEYARRMVAVKTTYNLTATTPERDALGQMLETC